MLNHALQLNLRHQDAVHGDGYKTHSRSRLHDVSNVTQLWFLEHQMGQRYILDEDLEKPMVQSMAYQAQYPKKGFAKTPTCCMVLSTYCSVKFSVHVKVSLKAPSAQNATQSVFSLFYLHKTGFCISNSFR